MDPFKILMLVPIAVLSVTTACVGMGPANGPVTGAQSTASSGPNSCSVGQESCMGSCVDTINYMNDSANCGRCENHCAISETCTGGFCTCVPAIRNAWERASARSAC